MFRYLLTESNIARANKKHHARARTIMRRDKGVISVTSIAMDKDKITGAKFETVQSCAVHNCFRDIWDGDERFNCPVHGCQQVICHSCHLMDKVCEDHNAGEVLEEESELVQLYCAAYDCFTDIFAVSLKCPKVGCPQLLCKECFQMGRFCEIH